MATPTRFWKDIDYVGDNQVGHRLDIYHPTGNGPFPVVIIIYGSAFKNNDGKDQAVERLGQPLLTAGFAIVSINHRASSEAIFPAQLHDVKAAVRFIRAHAEHYQLNPDAIGVTGYSSGGHLAAMLGTTGGIATCRIGQHKLAIEGTLGGYTGTDSRVQAVVDWFGPTDFLIMDACGSEIVHDAPDSPESILVGGPIQDNPERCALANPITYIEPDNPPFLILHGGADPLVPPCQSEVLYKALQAQGVPVDLTIVPGAGHGEGLFEAPYFAMMVQFFEKQLRSN